MAAGREPLDGKVLGIIGKPLNLAFRADQIRKIEMQNLMAPAGEVAAQLYLERVTSIVTDGNSHPYAPI